MLVMADKYELLMENVLAVNVDFWWTTTDIAGVC